MGPLYLAYTLYYTVENHFITDGNVANAVAAATSLEGRRIAQALGDTNHWRERTANRWRDWVKMCMFSKKWNVSTCSYGAKSRINIAEFGTVDFDLYNTTLDLIKTKSVLSDEGFADEFRKVSDIVDQIYAAGQFDTIFSGKWYFKFLVEDIKAIAGDTPYENDALPKRLRSTMAGSMNFDADWSDHFKRPLRDVIDML